MELGAFSVSLAVRELDNHASSSPVRGRPLEARSRQDLSGQNRAGRAHLGFGDQTFGCSHGHLGTERLSLAEELAELTDGPFARTGSNLALRQKLESGAEDARLDASHEAVHIQCVLVVESASAFITPPGCLVRLCHHKCRRPGDCDREGAVVTFFECPDCSHLLVNQASFNAGCPPCGLRPVGSKSGSAAARAGERLGHNEVHC